MHYVVLYRLWEPNQRGLLQRLAFNPTVELYNKKTLISLKMSQSSTQKSIATLLEKDLVTAFTKC